MATRMLLVDDQVLFVESLKTVLNAMEGEFEVVGISHNGQEALEAVEALHPEVVLMDVRMPVLDGVETTRILHDRHPEVLIIMLTTFDDDDYVKRALKLGASGYLLKNISPAALKTSIKAIIGGSVLVDSSLIGILVHQSTALEEADTEHHYPQDILNRIQLLSSREREVLRLLAQGYGNRQIMGALFIAEQTVRNHICSIYTKLGFHDRYEVMRLAIQAGLTASVDQ